MRRLVPAVMLVCAGAPALLTAQLMTPADWKWRQDAAAPLASGAKMEPGSWVFVQMPPGWHVTTGPGVLLYPSAHGDVGGNFSLEAEIFLFSGESSEEYGVFLGGHDIEGAATPDYSALVLRRDGQARCYAGAPDRRPWSPPGSLMRRSFRARPATTSRTS
jgi:hypothetical protein